ncbi:restriction system-associated AAA family ATPase [Pedobacter foliorum]|uniref:restriction system-associated AAA family ATPase n=1 Tax=Pedobacter foliorum TaxID=2739058 RepID=UPI0015673F85|nr:restriction system-associated AAA family ATPase [Pedobacter foliorum]NRF40220.1 restriction system-associated AAA family ATPase [Pedobacter foliorum]
MKLLSLEIDSQYGSIKSGFKLQFRIPYDNLNHSTQDWKHFHPFCFAGLNGSGKSNVLEVLANIFYHIECCANVSQPEMFITTFDPSSAKPSAFKLQYYIQRDKGFSKEVNDLTLVTVTKKENEIPVMQHQPFPFDSKPIPVTVVAEKYSKIQAEAKKYLPDLIVGYSSGENEILSIPFLKTRLIHFDEYYEAVKNKLAYNEPESSLIYIDYEMSQAVLLSNYIFQDQKVLDPLHTELGIKDIKRFRMNLNLHPEDSIGILSRYQTVIDKFKSCSTSYYEDKDHIILDFWINPKTKDAFKLNFEDGIFELFRAFQILYTLNYKMVSEGIKSDVYESKGFYTDGKVPNPSPEDKVFYFLDYYIEKEDKITKEVSLLLMKNLSDGEQQFLHTLGICLMLRDKTTLLLLDEPETHFNPDWRSKFVQILQKSLEESGSNNMMKDILITSHSPFIISDCFPDKVIVFEKGKQPISAQQMGFRTYGTSIDIIMENVFKKNNTIGDKSKDEIDKIQVEIKNKKSLTKAQVTELKNKTNHLGDSMEKILLFAKLNQLEK